MQYEKYLQALQPLQEKWAGLADRERKLVGCAGVMIFIASFYWLIWQPISDAEAQSLKKLSRHQSTLSYVKATANQIASLQGASVQQQSKIYCSLQVGVLHSSRFK